MTHKWKADIYDITRKRLLSGREEMLAMVAAQLKFQLGKEPAGKPSQKPIWVDIGGGTGWNIETMSAYLDVPNFFSAIYLVDLSPSLCNVARQRFERLGWQNVKVICQDACKFNLGNDRADVVTMSYSLSMIPSFHVAVDSIASLLKPKGGFLAVVDFYVQSIVETSGRNYIGSSLTRHVNWLGRTFWRAWFDLDRVGLEGARRVSLSTRSCALSLILPGLPRIPFRNAQGRRSAKLPFGNKTTTLHSVLHIPWKTRLLHGRRSH
jgi:betaine lipid synthase